MLLARKTMTNLSSILKSRDITLTKVPIVKAMIFSVVMYRCESWTIKKVEHGRTDAFELWSWRSLESPLDCKMKPVNTKGNQPWIFIGRTDAKAEAPIVWPPDAKSQLTGKAPDAGKDYRQEEKGITEDEMVELYHWLNRHEFDQALGLWWTGKPGMLQSMGWQRVGYDWATELNWMLGKIEGKRRRGQERMRWLDSIIDSMDMSLSKPREVVKDRRAWCAIVMGMEKSQTQLIDQPTT